MQPVAHERLAGGAFALSDFVLVMRKCQVDSTGVNIQGLSEILHGHCGALNVPARSAGSDRSLPEVLSRFRGFPQREIPRALLFVAVVVDAYSSLYASQIHLLDLSISWEFRDALINRTFARIRDRIL